MKAIKKVLLLIVLAASALASGAALAHGSVRFSVGIGVGFPLWGPGYYYPYYPYPYYYPPAYYNEPAAIPAQPQRYVEQPQASNMWYYCAESKTYYPYVKDCPAGWQRVSPTPR